MSEPTAELPQRVNAVDPGLVFTRMSGFAEKDPKQVTEVFLYLTSDVPRGVTGRVLRASDYRSQKAA